MSTSKLKKDAFGACKAAGKSLLVISFISWLVVLVLNLPSTINSVIGAKQQFEAIMNGTYTVDFQPTYPLATQILTYVASVITFLTVSVFEYGEIHVCEKMSVSKELEVKDAFEGFNEFASAFLTGLLRDVFIVLWSLLFVIPGIVKSYSYSMAIYYSHKNPNMSANDCITKSKEAMVGHKADLFFLDLSFIGWFLLDILTLGILSIWLVPRYKMTRYYFYAEIDKENEAYVQLNAQR